jgi:UPF0755 protein
MIRAISVIFIIVLVGTIILGIGIGYLANQFFFISPDQGAEVINFTVDEGENAGQIARSLEQTGIVKNGLVFRAYVKWTKTDSDFQTGVFELKPGMSMMEITSELTSSDVGINRATIIEGWTIRDIGFYFENKGMFQAEEIFERAGLSAIDYRQADIANPANEWKEKYDFLASKPDYVSLEGYLFPDTYYFYHDVTVDEIIERMLDNFDKKLKAEWRTEIKRQGKSIFDIITMASIIEREMYGLEDRKMVSDIFWKRLEIGMALQADSSVNYVTGKKTPAISSIDAQIDSLWNTYKYPGLPLGPICNPSAEAIEAAIYPTANDYYYFLTTPDGQIIYSKTHEEHVANKQKYLR